MSSRPSADGRGDFELVETSRPTVEEDKPEDEDEGASFVVTVLDLQGRKHKVSCDAKASVLDLKGQLVAKTDVEKERQMIIYRGRTLNDGIVLSEAGVSDGQTLHLFVRNAASAASAPTASTSHAPVTIHPPGPSNNNIRAAPPGEAASDYTAVQIDNDGLLRQFGTPYNPDLEEMQMRIQQTIKLWSCFLLLIYGMVFLSALSAYTDDSTQRIAAPDAANDEEFRLHLEQWQQDRSNEVMLMLFISLFGCYTGYVGLKAAERVNFRSMRNFTRCLIRLAVFSVLKAIFEVLKDMNRDKLFLMHITEEGKGELIEARDKSIVIHMAMVSAAITSMMWVICVHRALQLQAIVELQDQGSATAFRQTLIARESHR